MTKQQIRNKENVITNMCHTAKFYGKDDDRLSMVYLAERLHRMETTLQHLAEDECNFPTYDEKKQSRLEKLATKLITEQLGCKCYMNRDPRGFAIRMYLVDENGDKVWNCWDGETTGLDW